MSISTTPNQKHDIIGSWHGDATDPIEINLRDRSYLSNYYIAKVLLWLATIYTSLTERLTALENLVLELATGDDLATVTFPGLIIQYRQLLDQHHAIYKLA
jgi:hypothetical protein